MTSGSISALLIAVASIITAVTGLITALKAKGTASDNVKKLEHVKKVTDSNASRLAGVEIVAEAAHEIAKEALNGNGHTVA